MKHGKCCDLNAANMSQVVAMKKLANMLEFATKVFARKRHM